MKSPKTEPKLEIQTTDYTPTQAQIDMFARRLMPEIKKFFADEQIQKEFAEWKERQNIVSPDKLK